MDTRPVAAAISILSAMVVIGLIDNFVVAIAAEAGIWQFHTVRALMALPVFLIAVRLGFGPIAPVRWWAVTGRSAFLTCAMILYFASLGVLPVAQAAAGLFTAPIFVLIISALVLGQRIGPFRIGAVAVGFLGVLLILRPDAAQIGVWTIVPLFAGLFYAAAALATRTWCRSESTLTLLAGSFAGLGLAGAVGLVLFTYLGVDTAGRADAFILMGWVAPTPAFLFWTAVQAVGSLVGVFLIIRAYQLGEASYVGVFEYSLLVFISLWAWILRGETLDLRGAVGIALIIASGTVIALRSRRPEIVPEPAS